MDVLSRDDRTVALGRFERATYLGDSTWEITLSAPNRADRAHGKLMTRDVLQRLDGFERGRAVRIIAAFGDSV